MQGKILWIFSLLLLFGFIESQVDKPRADLTNPEAESSIEDGTESFVDNRIDQIPTYVPPAERFLKRLAKSLEIIGGQSNSNKNSTGATKIISGITKPITSILNPVGKTIGRGVSSSGFGDILNLFKDKFRAIYPGTLWCGSGDATKNEEEVGFFKVTDACCRDHDHCQSAITAGRALKGLRNDGMFTRSHCTCDDEFHACLKKAHSPIATKIGITYFNILRPQCFKEDYPATCKKYGGIRISRSKCKEYEVDTSKNITMQWFDNPDF